MMKEKDDQLSKQLWAMGDHVRLKIIRLLPHQIVGKNGKNVSQIAQEIRLSQPTVSHHLRVLRQADIIEFKKMSRDVFYTVKDASIKTIIQDLQEMIH